jgi:hypothetical protein
MTTRLKRLIGISAFIASAATVGIGMALPVGEACAASAPKLSFAEDIMPIFKGRCAGCHAPGQEGFDEGHQARQDGPSEGS